MPRKLVPLTNTANVELARLHGSPKKASERIRRNEVPSRPKDALGRRAGTLTERTLVVSDLHIGAGKNPVTGGWQPGDDFLAKQTRQFIAMLAKQWHAAATGEVDGTHPTKAEVKESLKNLVWASGEKIDLGTLGDLGNEGPYKLRLCLGGDVVDFLQAVVERPGLPYPDGQASYGGPKNTPANNIVQLNMIREGHPEFFRALAVHLKLGHSLDLRPGNHDRHFFNKHVLEGEIEVGGRKLGGFKKILEQELRAMGAGPKEVAECLARMNLLPIPIYDGQVFFLHGDDFDPYNRVQRPYQELLEPTPMHEEMSLALGDYGVRRGFNNLELLDPTLDAIDDQKLFFSRAVKHPKEAVGLVHGFLLGLQREGYTESPRADAEQRVKDIRALVDKVPQLVEMLNQHRPEGEKLTKEQVAEGLEAIERVSATPLFSRFRKGSKLFERMLTMGMDLLRGTKDKRNKDEISLDVLDRANEKLGLKVLLHGHDHAPREEAYLTPSEEMLRRIDTHTWTDKVGNNERWIETWGRDGRGVAVIDSGKAEDGTPFSRVKLHCVPDESGHLVESDILENPEPNPKKIAREVRQIFEG
jgi:hypothetical protein